MELIINPTSGTIYLPREFRNQGYLGKTRAYESAFALVIAKPGASNEDVLKGLEHIRADILMRTK